ncbi:hypothetical protein ABZX98_13470 [Streptomyces sp. NPDC002992]
MSRCDGGDTRKRRAALAEVAEHARVLLTTAPGDDIPFWALAWGPPAA